MTQNREKHSVISHFSFGCHGNRFHVKSDKVPLFNSEHLRKTADFEVRPLLYQELFLKPYVCKSYLRYSLTADAYNMCVISTCWHYHAREISTEWQTVKMGNFHFFFRMFKRDLQKLQALLLKKTCLFENLHPARFHLK